jgi:hypothetical protein
MVVPTQAELGWGARRVPQASQPAVARTSESAPMPHPARGPLRERPRIRARLHRLWKDSIEGGFVKGHDFSRAVKPAKEGQALAPEGISREGWEAAEPARGHELRGHPAKSSARGRKRVSRSAGQRVGGLAESAMEVPTQAALGWATKCGGGETNFRTV